jgi:hypothetical protein
MSKSVRAPVEQLYRAIIKHHFLTDSPPPEGPIPEGRFGSQRVLPPLLSEMGVEIRYHLARAEPWLRNGWKVVTRRPDFYPEGTVIDAPEFFAAADRIFAQYGVLVSRGAIIIPPAEAGEIGVSYGFDGTSGNVEIKLSNVTKVTTEVLAEIELRKLYLDWFHSGNRWISNYDRYVLSFESTTRGNFEYHHCAALRPGFLPPAFENPPESVPPHVGVQMRNMPEHTTQHMRNSDPQWMLATAKEIADHLDLDLLVYGHPNGCVIPEEGYKTTWNPARPDKHLARELGYLKSCRLMLSPDSGLADLMAWLEIPTLLEKVLHPGEFTCLAAGFRPKLRAVDRIRPIGAQADELLAVEGCVLPDDKPPPDYIDPRRFPWEP